MREEVPCTVVGPVYRLSRSFRLLLQDARTDSRRADVGSAPCRGVSDGPALLVPGASQALLSMSLHAYSGHGRCVSGTQSRRQGVSKVEQPGAPCVALLPVFVAGGEGVVATSAISAPSAHGRG